MSDPNCEVPIDQSKLVGMYPVSVKSPTSAVAKDVGLDTVNEFVTMKWSPY